MSDMWPPADRLSEYRLPAVPKDLMRYTCGHEDREEYERSGFEVAAMLNLASVKHFGSTTNAFNSVLDFGCGAGRLTSFLRPERLTGCDVNGVLIDFCKKTFPASRFDAIELMPPLPYADASFDLVVSFSVFSHLEQEVERAWLRELRRVGAEGCYYLISVQGDWMIEQTLGAEAAAAEAQGFYLRTVHERHGSRLDFPSYYESSYHTSAYIHANWSSEFEVIDVIKGDDPARYLSPGRSFGESGFAPIRPMGQDLVVCRRRP